MDLNNLQRSDKKRRKRVGRGHGSGSGKTAGRGQKGQKVKTGIPPGFQGGQNPLYMRLPTLRGISNKSHNIGIFRKKFAIINVGDLNRFDAGTEVDPQLLKDLGVVKKLHDGLKVLGVGEIEKALTVKANAFSAAARDKIEKAGGTAEVI